MISGIFENASVQERRSSAASDGATRRMLMELAVDPDYQVRRAVARNTQTSADALVLLVGGERDAICKIAFSDGAPDFDPNRVLRLSSEEDLLCIAAHVNVSEGTLSYLAGNDSLAVRLTAMQNPNAAGAILEEAAGSRHPKLRQVAAQQSTLPLSAFARLAVDDDVDVRLTLTRNPQVPSTVLESLAIDSNMRVRGGIAIRSGVPRHTLLRLARDPAGYVRVCAASNTVASVDLLHALSQDVEAQVRLRVAEHANAPNSALQTLAVDADDDIRLAVAKHASSDITILKRLAYDKVRTVQHAVFARDECTLFSEDAARVLLGFGVDPDLLFETSPRRFCAGVIASKHAAEVEFLFNDATMESVTGLSSLQAVFVKRNSDGALLSVDRYRYLEFLTRINTVSSHSGAFGVDPKVLHTVFEVLSQDQIIRIACEQQPGMARDSFRMLADVLLGEDGVVSGERAVAVCSWLAESAQYGAAFHDYLSRESVCRAESAGLPITAFPQASMTPAISAVNKALGNVGVEIVLPRTAGDLLKLGRVMRHCCGSRYYTDLCSDGRSTIFHLQPIGKPRRGATFQFDHRGALVQSKGFANSEPAERLVEMGVSVYSKLRRAARVPTIHNPGRIDGAG